MPNVNRRDVLKTIAVTGTVATIPMGAQALSKSVLTKSTANLKPIPLYVDVMLGQTRGKQKSEIINQGNKPVTITEFNPSSFKSINGQVTVNVKTPTLPVTLAPGESMPVYAEAVSPNSARSSVPVVPTIASEKIAISTTDASVNGELMVSVFDCQFV